MTKRLLYVALLLSGAVHGVASATDLYRPGNWPALATDQRAMQQGDILTIVIYQNATAQNSASSGTKKSNKLDGRIFAGSSFDKSGGLSINGANDNVGSTGRSGQMVAQISATVDEVLPNGDLRISGSQLLNINGERTTIKVKGRVRRADVSGDNAVLSNRIADAMIDYDGSGFVSRGGKPGIVSRIFSFLGLM